jgi:hypothetical protein
VARDPTDRVRTAAEAVLVDGETITSKGMCWAARRRGRIPLSLLARRQYLLALTDRRVLVFERGRRPKPSDLVLGKRYETFALEGVRRGFPLLQVRVRAANGNRMVFEFRPGQRELGGELVARLTPRTAGTATDDTGTRPAPPRPIETLMRASAPVEPATPPDPVERFEPAEDHDAEDHDAEDGEDRDAEDGEAGDRDATFPGGPRSSPDARS